ncbi:transporter [Bradyrhizobium japonicum]
MLALVSGPASERRSWIGFGSRHSLLSHFCRRPPPPPSHPKRTIFPGWTFRPPPNLFQFRYEYRSAPGSTRDVTTQTLNLRYDHAFYLTPTWTVVTRTDLPLLGRNTINSSNPNGKYIYGLGDADIQAAVIHDLDKRWAVGFGARLITPTGEDPLGSGKWRIMPIVGFRVALPEISKSSYFEPIFRYDVSVAGDPTRRNISNLQFGPALNIGLPDRWFVTFYPARISG